MLVLLHVFSTAIVRDVGNSSGYGATVASSDHLIAALGSFLDVPLAEKVSRIVLAVFLPLGRFSGSASRPTVPVVVGVVSNYNCNLQCLFNWPSPG